MAVDITGFPSTTTFNYVTLATLESDEIIQNVVVDATDFPNDEYIEVEYRSEEPILIDNPAVAQRFFQARDLEPTPGLFWDVPSRKKICRALGDLKNPGIIAYTWNRCTPELKSLREVLSNPKSLVQFSCL